MAVDPQIASSVISTAVSFLGGIFKGHSDWWHFDDELKKGNYQNCLNYMLKFYGSGGINNNDFKGGVSDNAGSQNMQWFGKPRYLLIPLLEQKTGKYEAKQLHQICVNAGLLPPTAEYKTPTQVAQEAADAKAKADTEAYAKAHPVDAQVKKAGLDPNILYFGLGIPILIALIYLLIRQIKKRRK